MNEHFYHLRLWQINEGYGVFVKCTWCNIKVFGIFKWRTLYQAVSDIQLVKQTEMVKSAIEEAERQTRKVFITTRFLLERSRHESLFYVMKLFFFFFRPWAVLLLGNNRIVLKEFMLWQVCRVFLSIFFFVLIESK